MNILSPSILASDYGRLAEALELISQGGAQYVHIDVMDGVFVSNISIGIPVVKAIRKYSQRIFDVHLMIVNPERYIKAFAEAGADIITIHAEACDDLPAAIEQIHSFGKKAGVAISPKTEIGALLPVISSIDMALVMTVEPGLGGQSLIEYTLDKVRALRQEAEARGIDLDIQVDGGITIENVGVALEAGANVIVAGSAVYRGDIIANTKAFLEKMNP